LAFPSAHAACAFSAAAAILLTRPPFEGAAALVLSTLVGFSRIYVGVHYLTDVLGGAVTGVLCAAGTYFLFF
ncbi:phosphatase PAP2 family protein, partial [Ruminococcus sp.]|uniref:phosphatase PAP2 family protein n=1 Tax=Ruminococcus sp. TaxID=41978 RepID=UPI002E8078C2